MSRKVKKMQDLFSMMDFEEKPVVEESHAETLVDDKENAIPEPQILEHTHTENDSDKMEQKEYKTYSVEEVKAIAKLGPNILVAEPSELIGTGKPADKEYVDEVIKVIREINPDIKPFPSAGISKGEDCYNIIKAGASASGCSSAIAKAENPLKLAEEMISAVRRAYDERVNK